MQDPISASQSIRDRRRRLWLTVLIPVFSIALLVILVLAIRGGPPPAAPATPVPVAQIVSPTVAPTWTPRPAATATAIPTLPPTTEATPLPSPTPTVAPEEILAVINNRIVTSETVDLVQRVDAAMADLLGRPAEPADTLLDRVINLALTAQAADLAGFALEAGQTAQSRDALLANNGRSLDALTVALTTQDLSLAQFDAYLGQLLRTNQFLQGEASARGITADEFLAQLQAEARISLGPVAAQLAAALPTPTPEPSTPTPEPATPEPVAEVETPLPLEVFRSRGTGIGQLLPDFALPLAADPGTIVTADSLIGRPTLISFYTTWCPYCKRQTPILVETFGRYADQGVQFLGIDVKEPAGVALPYIQEHGIPYPVVLDESGSAGVAYGIPGYPTTFFLDRQGQIVDRHIGALTQELLEGYLARMIDAP